jgi:phage repressor protein C with HTH and peptisase S24 domain
LESQPKENNSIYKPIYSSKVDYITVRHGKNKVSAGEGFVLPEANSEENYDYIKVPDTYEAQNCDYTLTVEGNSMYPFFKNGEIVFVKEQPEIEIGQIGIFIIDNELAYIKKRGKDKLVSLNEEFEDIPFVEGKDIICKGLVIGKV